jgi:hypothetical protein
MNTATTVTPDTPLFALTTNASGYTLLDGILGDMSAADYAANVTDREADLLALCEWITYQASEGAYFSQAEFAEAAVEAAREMGERPYATTVTGFTPREVQAKIFEMAEREAGHALA